MQIIQKNAALVLTTVVTRGNQKKLLSIWRNMTSWTWFVLGPKLIWTNGRKGHANTLIRLDRVLAN